MVITRWFYSIFYNLALILSHRELWKDSECFLALIALVSLYRYDQLLEIIPKILISPQHYRILNSKVNISGQSKQSY